MAENILQMVLALAGIVAVIVGGGLVLRRLNKISLSAPGPMQVVASLSLGIKEKLLLVQVGEQQILLAVSAAGINTVHVFTEPVVVETPAGQSDFTRKLQEIMAQGRTQE
jgi:flagellar protein FliO/FliZ